MTTNTLLAQLNAIRGHLGMKPLKAWKGSKAALQKKITELKADVTTDDNNTAPAAKKSPAKKTTKKSTAKRTTKKASAKKTTAKASDDKVSVADICRQFDINPKVGRAKLRRNGLSSNDNRWKRVTPGSADHKKIIDILEN